MKCVTHILCRTCDHSFICNITSGSSLNKTDRLLLVCVAHIAESRSSPDEDRLLKHLFDPEFTTDNMRTTPVLNEQETMNINVSIHIIKLIALVSVVVVFI